MLADDLIQAAWKSAHPTITLWNSFTPVDEGSTPSYPMAEVVPSGYSEEALLGGLNIETQRFRLSIADTSRTKVFELARTARRAIEQIQDDKLVGTVVELAEFATPWDGGGRQIVWELELTVTLQLTQERAESWH